MLDFAGGLRCGCATLYGHSCMTFDPGLERDSSSPEAFSFFDPATSKKNWSRNEARQTFARFAGLQISNAQLIRKQLPRKRMFSRSSQKRFISSRLRSCSSRS